MTASTIAGVAIPDSTLAREATEFVRDVSSRLLFDHSRRVFLWASLQARPLALSYDAELLYVAALFHDVGLLEGHRSAHERFEIDGANAARAFLERHGLAGERLMTAWMAIALHTTRQIPDYMAPEVRLVALGVQSDIFGTHLDTLTHEQRGSVLEAHPRTNFADGMIAALSAGIRDKPETAEGTNMTDILEATVPGYVRRNLCDAIRAACEPSRV
jgi:hypothetical protein